MKAFLAAPETRGLNIEQFIIKPFQRITKYPLLLKELIKVTNDESPDLPHRKAALAELHSLVAKINQAKSVQDRVLEVMESIGDITVLPQVCSDDIDTMSSLSLVDGLLVGLRIGTERGRL